MCFPYPLGGTFSFMWLIERQFCNSLKISGGIMWNDVEEIGTPGEETKMLAISVDFTLIPRERTVRPGSQPILQI